MKTTPKFRKEKSKQEIPTASFVTPKEIPQNIGIEIERTAEGYVVRVVDKNNPTQSGSPVTMPKNITDLVMLVGIAIIGWYVVNYTYTLKSRCFRTN